MTFAMWDPQGRYGKYEKRAIKARHNKDRGSLNTTWKCSHWNIIGLKFFVEREFIRTLKAWNDFLNTS